MSEAPAPYVVPARAAPAPPEHPAHVYRAVIAALVLRLRERQRLDVPHRPRVARLRALEAAVIAQAHALDLHNPPTPLRGSQRVSGASSGAPS